MTVGDPRVLAQVSCLSPTVRVTGHLLRREIIIWRVWDPGGPWDAFSCRPRLSKCTKCGTGTNLGVEAGRPALSPQQAQVTETSHAVVNVIINVETSGCVFPLDLATQGSNFHLLAHRACAITFRTPLERRHANKCISKFQWSSRTPQTDWGLNSVGKWGCHVSLLTTDTCPGAPKSTENGLDAFPKSHSWLVAD